MFVQDAKMSKARKRHICMATYAMAVIGQHLQRQQQQHHQQHERGLD